MSDWSSTYVGMVSLQKLRRRHHTCEVFSNQCPRLVKKCYFTSPFEGLDTIPGFPSKKTWNSTASFCPPLPSPSTGVGIMWYFFPPLLQETSNFVVLVKNSFFPKKCRCNKCPSMWSVMSPSGQAISPLQNQSIWKISKKAVPQKNGRSFGKLFFEQTAEI